MIDYAPLIRSVFHRYPPAPRDWGAASMKSSTTAARCQKPMNLWLPATEHMIMACGGMDGTTFQGYDW